MSDAPKVRVVLVNHTGDDYYGATVSLRPSTCLDGAADLASVLRESTKMHVILDDRYREYEWTGHGTGRATSTTLERQREEDRRTSVLLREIRDAATQQKNEGR